MRTVTLERRGLREYFRIPSADAWGDLAELVASRLWPGDIVALSGPLGAGKTTFVQALARALGIKRMPQSPTFALMRSYALPRRVHGIKRLVHVDAYRIENERDLLALDLEEELVDGMSALVVEWPENISRIIEKHRGTVFNLAINPG